MLNIKPILSNTKKINICGIVVTTAAISLLALIDVAIIDKIANIGKSTDQIQLITTIAAAMAFRSIANLVLLHFQSHFSFKVYQDLVTSRCNDIVINGSMYEKSKLVNYVGNESLQAILTVLMPSLALMTSAAQMLLLTAGTVYVSGYLLLEIALPIAILYAIYIVPMQYFLSKRGVERRAADELRSDYLNNAIKSLDELKYYGKRSNIEDRYVLETTSKINKGLTLKWANSEGQKSVLELCGVGGIAAWYYATIPGRDEIVAVSGLIFLFYRIAPLITRIAIAYQSLVYGRASTELPKITASPMSFNVEIFADEMTIKNKKTTNKLHIKNNGVTLLMGPSGVGKSTLLREIGGAIASTGLKIGFVGQTPLVLNGTLIDNLQVSYEQAENQIIKFGLEELNEDGRILSSTSVSGGESMRISLLRIYLNEPDILLIDEPFAALDAENKVKIAEMLNTFSESRPVICVTHEIPPKLEVRNVMQLG
jgi:ABC-type transport system involved in cytochrome bd biosynthesis fused ATPase/permease subunit